MLFWAPALKSPAVNGILKKFLDMSLCKGLFLLYELFLWIGLTCVHATEPLQGDRQLLSTKSPDITDTNLINLKVRKVELTVVPPSDFESGTTGLVIQNGNEGMGGDSNLAHLLKDKMFHLSICWVYTLTQKREQKAKSRRTLALGTKILHITSNNEHVWTLAKYLLMF